MSIGQKFEKVADAVYEKGYTKGGLDASPQETVSGGMVAITDISPIEHNVAVRASSKNLLPYPYHNTSKTLAGITYTDNGDGSVTVNGTATDYSMFYLAKEYPFKAGETYTFGEELLGVDMYVRFTNENGETKYATKTITWKEDYKLQFIYLQVNPNGTVSGTSHPFMVKGNSYDGIWTPFVPDVSVATVKACGKNICDYTKFVGISIVDKANVVLDGDTFIFPAGNSYYGLNMTNGLPLVKGQTYTFSYEVVTSYAYPECQINYTDGTKIVANNGKTVTIDNKDIKSINFYIATGALAETDLKLSKFHVEAGTAVREYEYPIQPISYPIAADGTVEGVTSIYPNMTITTDTVGVVIDANYYQDAKKVKENLIDMILSLGGVINE